LRAIYCFIRCTTLGPLLTPTFVEESSIYHRSRHQTSQCY
jgi:hypothetical protein